MGYYVRPSNHFKLCIWIWVVTGISYTILDRILLYDSSNDVYFANMAMMCFGWLYLAMVVIAVAIRHETNRKVHMHIDLHIIMFLQPTQMDISAM